MVTIHLIRHGETDRNGTHYIGRSDPPLNAAGLAQAEDLAGRLCERPIRLVISSPLRRALQTAHPLASRLDLRIEQDPALMEFDFGDLQDLPKATLGLSLRKDHARFPVAGGESLHDLWLRLRPVAMALMDRKGRAEEAEIAVVGHYWSNRMLCGHLRGLDFDGSLAWRGYKPANGSVETLHLD